MARVAVLQEVRRGELGQWQLCFQWCCYLLDDITQFGYRFVWRRPDDGSIQGARGQARIPSLSWATELMKKAEDAGWANRDGDLMEEAAQRLRAAGCRVELASGHVGWPDKAAADRSRLTDEIIKDAALIQDWCR